MACELGATAHEHIYTLLINTYVLTSFEGRGLGLCHPGRHLVELVPSNARDPTLLFLKIVNQRLWEVIVRGSLILS